MSSFRKQRGKVSTEPVEVQRAGMTRRPLTDPLPEVTPPQEVPQEASVFDLGGYVSAEALREMIRGTATGRFTSDGEAVEGSMLPALEVTRAAIANITPEDLRATMRSMRGMSDAAQEVATSIRRPEPDPAAIRREDRDRNILQDTMRRISMIRPDWDSMVQTTETWPDGRTTRHDPEPLGPVALDANVDYFQTVETFTRYHHEIELTTNSSAGNRHATATAAMSDYTVQRLLPEAVAILEGAFIRIDRWLQSFIIAPDGCPALVGIVVMRGERAANVIGISLRNMHVYRAITAVESQGMRLEQQLGLFLARMVSDANPELRAYIRP